MWCAGIGTDAAGTSGCGNPPTEHGKINWHELFEGLIGEFDAEALARRQREAAAAGIPEAVCGHGEGVSL